MESLRSPTEAARLPRAGRGAELLVHGQEAAVGKGGQAVAGAALHARDAQLCSNTRHHTLWGWAPVLVVVSVQMFEPFQIGTKTEM